MVSIMIGRRKLTQYSVLILFFLFPLLPAIAADQPLIIVFPLETSPISRAPKWLGEGIAVSLSDQLNGRSVRSMDRSERIKLVESLDLPPGASLSRGSIIRVAQRAEADLVVIGAYSGTERNLRISARILHIKTLKLSGEMVANGPLSALTSMENELAWLIFTNNDFEKAPSREKFQERIRRIPNAAYAAYIQSLSVLGKGEQLHLLLRAVESYKDFPEAQLRLGRIYFLNGDCGSAIPHLLLGRNDPKVQLEIEFMHGTCYLSGDQLPQAIQAFGQLLQISRPFEALNNIGVAYLRKGDIVQALSALQEARSAVRTDPAVSLNLAIARHLQGIDSAAKTILEEACKAHPKNGMLQFMLGFVLKALGEQDKAAAAMSKARNLGINVEKLLLEDPKMWSGALSNLEIR
jgi:Flp pilus assembly protein TadD